jgi:hypothetical protein
MKTVKTTLVLATLVAAVALSACRREEHHKPMKLGAEVPATTQVSR